MLRPARAMALGGLLILSSLLACSSEETGSPASGAGASPSGSSGQAGSAAAGQSSGGSAAGGQAGKGGTSPAGGDAGKGGSAGSSGSAGKASAAGQSGAAGSSPSGGQAGQGVGGTGGKTGGGAAGQGTSGEAGQPAGGSAGQSGGGSSGASSGGSAGQPAGGASSGGASSGGSSSGGSSGSSSGGSGAAGSAGGGTSPGSVGCGQAVTPGFQCFDESFGGNARRWCAWIPDSYDSGKPYSVVLGLHGCGGSPEGAHKNNAPEEAAGASDHLFVFPKALGSCWEYGGSTIDTEFVKHVLGKVQAQFCVEPKRVFAHGMSSGGMMTSRVLCDQVAVAGAAISLNYSCGASPHPIWLYGGTADEYYSSYIVPGRDGWRKANGCSDATTPIANSPCVEYQGCTHRTIWCSENKGHVWPTDPWTAGIIDLFRSVKTP